MYTTALLYHIHCSIVKLSLYVPSICFPYVIWQHSDNIYYLEVTSNYLSLITLRGVATNSF